MANWKDHEMQRKEFGDLHIPRGPTYGLIIPLSVFILAISDSDGISWSIVTETSDGVEGVLEGEEGDLRCTSVSAINKPCLLQTTEA